MESIRGWIDTGLLLVLFGMAIGFGRWAVLKLWAIETKLEVACKMLPPLEAKCDRNDQRLDAIEVAFAGHCASPHCGEENEKKS